MDFDILSIGPEAKRRRRPHLSDEAAAYVRELIMSGQLTPGTFVRPDAIAEALGSSVTPVREALVMLRGEGFLEQAPHRGFRVGPLSGDDIRDLFVSQALLAGELAARAVVRCSDAEIDAIRAVQRRIESALAQEMLEDLQSLNHEFHRLINLGARSPRMSWLLKLATSYLPRRFFTLIAGWPQASAEDHVIIVESFEKRAPEEARMAMGMHFRHAGELLAAQHEIQSDRPANSTFEDSRPESNVVWP